MWQGLIENLKSEDNGFLETKNTLDRQCQNHGLCDGAIARIGECECLILTAAAIMEGSMWNTKIHMSSSGRPSAFKASNRTRNGYACKCCCNVTDGWL